MRKIGAHTFHQNVISIRKASHMLGVSEATLRQWTDEGKLKAFLTPGGHRRYSVSDLNKFTKSSRRVLGIKDLAAEMEDTLLLHAEIARGFLEKNGSQFDLNNNIRQHFATMGRQLLVLLVKYISEKSRREETLVAGRSIGASFGKDLAGLHWDLTDCVQAFISHRDPFIQTSVQMIGKHEMVRSNLKDTISLANHFIDQAMISMINAHQQHFADGSDVGKP